MERIEKDIRQRVTVRIIDRSFVVTTKKGARVASFRSLEHEYKFPGWSSEADALAWFWEWVDRDELIESYNQSSMLTYAKGKRSAKARKQKLSARQVLHICRLYDYEGETQETLAKRYGVSRTSIANIIQGRFWSEVTGRGKQHE